MKRTCSSKKLLIITGIFTPILVCCVSIVPPAAANPPILYLFWGEGCPHCEKEKRFLEEFHQQYPQVELRLFETWQHPEFAQLADAVRQTYQIKGVSVPLTVLGEWSLVGFSSSNTTGKQIIAQVETCLQQGCPDALDTISQLAIVTEIRTEAANNAPNGWERYLAGASLAKTQGKQEKVVVYYFYGIEDCEVCPRIEQLTRKAIEEGFKEALRRGVVEIQSINAEDPENRHFIEKYQLIARAVIVSDVVQGKETRWKPITRGSMPLKAPIV